MPVDWGELGSDAFSAALAWFMQQKDEGTPNFYNVPLTPEQKWEFDKRKELVEGGGSPQAQDLRTLAYQYLGQIPTAPKNFSFMSDALKGQAFAGGMEVPKFDLSKLNGQQAPPQRPPFTGVPGDGENPRPGAPFPNETGPFRYGDGVPRPGEGLPEGWNTLRDMDAPPGQGDPNYQRVSSAWNEFKTSHPNWAKIGVNGVLAALTAMTGLPGAIVGRFLREFLLNDKGGQPLPNPTKSFGDVAKNAPGTQPVGGVPVPNYPRDDRFEPTPLPDLPWDRSTFGGQRQEQLARNFNTDLMNPRPEFGYMDTGIPSERSMRGRGRGML